MVDGQSPVPSGKIWVRDRPALLILLVGLGLRAWWFQGIGLNDDTEYADAAYRLATGTGLRGYALGSIDSIRFGVVLPLAAVYRVFGISNLTSGLFPLACSGLTMWLTYVLGRNLFSPPTGTVALALLATFPLDIEYSTQLVPTVPVATCWLVALSLFVASERDARKHSWASNAFAVLSGVTLGVSWLCSESGPLLAVVLVTWTLIAGTSWKSLALAAAGALAVFLLECAMFRVLTGSFVWRLHVMHAEAQRAGTNIAAEYYPRTLFKVYRPDFSSQEGHFGLSAYVFLASLPVLLWSSSKRALALWVSVVLVMLWFQFGVMTLNGRPIAKWIRYLIVLLPFALLACSHSLLVIGRRAGRFALPVLLAVVLGTNLASARAAQEANAEQTSDFKATAAAIRTLPPGTDVYVGWGERGFLDVYLGRSRPLRGLDTMDPADLEDSYVVLNGSRNAVENPVERLKTELLLTAARAGWVEVARVRTATTGVFGLFDPLLYHVPPRSRDKVVVLARIKDPTGDLVWDNPPRVDIFAPDVVEASVSFDPEIQALDFEWTFKDPIPDNANAAAVGLVCFWRVTLDGSDPWKDGPDFYVRLGWYPPGVGLFVDDGRPDNDVTFDSTCAVNRHYRVRGAVARATVPLRCFQQADRQAPLASFSLEATFEAAIMASRGWSVRDVAATVATAVIPTLEGR